MTDEERNKYDGRDMVILDRHTSDTIAEDELSFPMQMENTVQRSFLLTAQKADQRCFQCPTKLLSFHHIRNSNHQCRYPL